MGTQQRHADPGKLGETRQRFVPTKVRELESTQTDELKITTKDIRPVAFEQPRVRLHSAKTVPIFSRVFTP